MMEYIVTKQRFNCQLVLHLGGIWKTKPPDVVMLVNIRPTLTLNLKKGTVVVSNLCFMSDLRYTV